MSLISEAVSKRTIGFERVRDNFRKLLKHYARDIKAEVLNIRHQDFVRFVSCYSASISWKLFSTPSIQDQKLHARILGDFKSWQYRQRAEEYFGTIGNINKRSIVENEKYGGFVAGLDEDNDQDYVDEDSDREELYSGNLPHLHHMENFILGSVAYQTLHRRLHEFVYPSLRSELRDLLEAWSRPGHEYHAHVAHYQLPNLVAELQHIAPDQIKIDIEDGNNHFVHKFVGSCQNAVERWTGERWDWWPMPLYPRPLKQEEARVQWKCVRDL
jgi:hypothetical protein